MLGTKINENTTLKPWKENVEVLTISMKTK